jgi:hypothetical protein
MASKGSDDETKLFKDEFIKKFIDEFFQFGQTRTDTLTFWYELFKQIEKESKHNLTEDTIKEHCKNVYNSVKNEFYEKMCESGHGDCAVECIYSAGRFYQKMTQFNSLIHAYMDHIKTSTAHDDIEETEKFIFWAFSVQYTLHLVSCEVTFHSKPIQSEAHYALALKPKDELKYHWLIVDPSLVKWFHLPFSGIHEDTSTNDKIYTAMGTDLFFKWNKQKKDEHSILVTCEGKVNTPLSKKDLDKFKEESKEIFFAELLKKDTELELRLKDCQKLKVIINCDGFFINHEKVDNNGKIQKGKRKVDWQDEIPSNLDTEKPELIEKISYLSEKWKLIEYARSCLE